jgi:ABC-type sugar transport system ATPase subunit
VARVDLRGLRKSFGAFEAVRGVDLTIEEGSFVVFVGPSGCGKSTLLRLIAGLEEPTGGTILIDGEDVTDLSPAERGLAMVFQSYALYPHMSVRDNMAFSLRMAGIDRVTQDQKVQRLRGSSSSTRCCIVARANSPVVNASAWPSAARSFETLVPSSSTSPCRTLTRLCGLR